MRVVAERAVTYALSGHGTGAGITIKDVDFLGLVEVLDDEALELVEGLRRDLLVDGAPPDLIGTTGTKSQPMSKTVVIYVDKHVTQLGMQLTFSLDGAWSTKYLSLGERPVNLPVSMATDPEEATMLPSAISCS